MTPKQERFVAEYLIDLNATAAARRAGYSEKTAGAIGAENLAKPQILAALNKAKNAVAVRANVTVDEIVGELRNIAMADIRKAIQWGETVMVPCAPDVAEAFLRGAGADDDEGTPIPVKAHTPLALIPSDQIDAATAAAISEIRMTPSGLAFKMHNKVDALAKLLAHLAPIEKPAATSNVVNINQMLVSIPETRQQFREMLDNVLPVPATLDS